MIGQLKGIRQCTPQRKSFCVAAAKGFGVARPKAPPKSKQPATPPEPCPCQSGKSYKNCCELVHNGSVGGGTPETTLRARFAAYVKGQQEFLVSTTHPDYHIFHYQVPTPGGATDRLREDIATACNKFAFTGLKILKSEPGENEFEGYVSYEYLSRKRSAPGAPLTEEELKSTTDWSRTAERSRFLNTSSGWQFVDYQTATFDANMLSDVAQPAQ